MVKYCSACWRKERHVALKFNSLTYHMLMVGTLGIAWFLLPKKCTCCGKVRIL